MQVAKNSFQKLRMFGVADAPEVRHAADIPEQFHRRPVTGTGGNLGHLRQRFQRQEVIGIARTDQHFMIRCRFKRTDQRIRRTELQPRVTPMQLAHRGKPVIHDRLRHTFIQRLGLTGHAKGAVRHATPGAARDLGQLIGHQHAHPTAVEFHG